MSMTRTANFRRVQDHFEPQDDDPQAQKRLRGQLEHIDYTAFASNKEVIAQALGEPDVARFQRLAVTVSQARAQWVAAALAVSDAGRVPGDAEIAKLSRLRMAYEELAEAYEGLRRMVERGYLQYRPAALR